MVISTLSKAAAIPTNLKYLFLLTYCICMAIVMYTILEEFDNQLLRAQNIRIEGLSAGDRQFLRYGPERCITPSHLYHVLGALGPHGRDMYKNMALYLLPYLIYQFIVNTFPPTCAFNYQVRKASATGYMVLIILWDMCISEVSRSYPWKGWWLAYTTCWVGCAKGVALTVVLASILYEVYVWFEGLRAKYIWLAQICEWLYEAGETAVQDGLSLYHAYALARLLDEVSRGRVPMWA
jgi:uncharacterized membrane protein